MEFKKLIEVLTLFNHELKERYVSTQFDCMVNAEAEHEYEHVRKTSKKASIGD